MTRQVRRFLIIGCVVTLSGIPSFAQSPERGAAGAPPQTLGRPPSPAPNPGPADSMAGEIALLRQTLQTLNARLREISDKASAPDARQGDSLKEQQDRISLGLDLLSRAEQRAGTLRKELIELIEKETSFRSRLVQLDEEARPDSIERATSLIGTTRAPELRDARRRILDNERRGVESLLGQTSQSRNRLEDDVRQADALVLRLRQRVLPLIDKEIEKITPD
ncbi:MAG TPA: hypothetical protein VK421_10250 [Pyrinomonadaceae bacterium]|nr:hypothetical protein [Pyrinomonadaceae bacterium]